MLQPPLDSKIWLSCFFEQLLIWLKFIDEKSDESGIESEQAKLFTFLNNNVASVCVIFCVVFFLQPAVTPLTWPQKHSRKSSPHLKQSGKSILSGLVESPCSRSPNLIRSGASCCSGIHDDLTSCSPITSGTPQSFLDETAEITIESIGGKRVQLTEKKESVNREDQFKSRKLPLSSPLSNSTSPQKRRSANLRSFLSFWTKSADELPVPSFNASATLQQLRQKYSSGERSTEIEELHKIGASLEEEGEKLFKAGRLNESLKAFRDSELVYIHSLEGILHDMADKMHAQSLYHHDRGDTRLATVLIGAAESIRERPTPKNILFCTKLHNNYREYGKHHRRIRNYSKEMDVYIHKIQAQAPVMARVLRAQAKCRH